MNNLLLLLFIVLSLVWHGSAPEDKSCAAEAPLQVFLVYELFAHRKMMVQNFVEPTEARDSTAFTTGSDQSD